MVVTGLAVLFWKYGYRLLTVTELALLMSQSRHKPYGPTVRVGRRQSRCLRGVLTIEMILTLPILMVVGFAGLQLSMMLIASQALGAAAHVGAREATRPGASADSVAANVSGALQGFNFQDDVEVVIFINGLTEIVSPLVDAVTGDEVSVTVRVPATKVAPDALKFVGITFYETNLQTTYVMRKE